MTYNIAAKTDYKANDMTKGKSGSRAMSAYREDVKRFKALADENRLQILELLQQGEKCACVLLDELHIAQSTLSHHMKILVDAGLVDYRKEGKWMHYTLNAQAKLSLKASLDSYLG